MIYFINQEHQDSFKKLIERYGAKNRTEIAVLYLFSSVQELVDHADAIFVIGGNYILPDGRSDLRLSSGEQVILNLAFNLFNGICVDSTTISPYNALGMLDGDYQRVYLQAIAMRFGLLDLPSVA